MTASSDPERSSALTTTPAAVRVQARPTVRAYLTALALVATSGAIAKLLQLILSLPDPALVFLTGVLFVAVVCGFGPSIVAALASVLVYDFCFVEPLYTLSVTKPQDVLSLLVFLVVAVLTSNLTLRVRNQAAAIAMEQTRVYAALREKAKTEAVIESSEDGLIVLDPAGVVMHVNAIACAILDVPRPEAIGQRFDDLATRHPHYLRLRAAVRDFLARPEREGDRVEITLFLRGRDHYYVLRPTPFQAGDGSQGGLILALQDVTYLRDQEARREQLVATLSHELRTPITSLSMALELLGRNGARLDAEQRTLLDTAREDVTRLQDVAQRLLDLSRGQAMTIALERRGIDLTDIVERAMKIFAIQAREKHVTLHASLPQEHLLITGDQTKLTWAISNLLSNALRYTPVGGRVEIEATCTDSGVAMAVSDTGPGIPPAQRERIFERFVQAPDSGEIGAAGLGLAIVRDIVQAHGGRIHLESTVGRGSRFVLELPRG